MSREEALKLARPEEGLDLIETVSTATPPVAKVMSYDKFRYEEEKRLKKERVAQKTAELKQVQTSARSALNDLQIKAKQAEKFLEEGHPVEVAMRLRGREKAHKEWAVQKLEEFLKMITIEHKRISDVRFGGRGLGVQIIKK